MNERMLLHGILRISLVLDIFSTIRYQMEELNTSHGIEITTPRDPCGLYSLPTNNRGGVQWFFIEIDARKIKHVANK